VGREQEEREEAGTAEEGGGRWGRGSFDVANNILTALPLPRHRCVALPRPPAPPGAAAPLLMLMV